jgi:hypothetical protein
MSELHGKFRSRRELFAGALRYATLGLLTAGSAALYAKRQRLVRQGICISDGICTGCEILDRCDLPAALSAKNLVGVNRDGR